MLRYFDQYIFCKVHSIGPINVCTNFEINRYKIDEFRKHAKLGNILKSTKSLYDFRFKSYGSNSGFHVFGDLGLDH